MTSAQKGVKKRIKFADKQFRFCSQGGGVKNSQSLVDITYGSPQGRRGGWRSDANLTGSTLGGGLRRNVGESASTNAFSHYCTDTVDYCFGVNNGDFVNKTSSVCFINIIICKEYM